MFYKQVNHSPEYSRRQDVDEKKGDLIQVPQQGLGLRDFGYDRGEADGVIELQSVCLLTSFQAEFYYIQVGTS